MVNTRRRGDSALSAPPVRGPTSCEDRLRAGGRVVVEDRLARRDVCRASRRRARPGRAPWGLSVAVTAKATRRRRRKVGEHGTTTHFQPRPLAHARPTECSPRGRGHRPACALRRAPTTVRVAHENRPLFFRDRKTSAAETTCQGHEVQIPAGRPAEQLDQQEQPWPVSQAPKLRRRGRPEITGFGGGIVNAELRIR